MPNFRSRLLSHQCSLLDVAGEEDVASEASWKASAHPFWISLDITFRLFRAKLEVHGRFSASHVGRYSRHPCHPRFGPWPAWACALKVQSVSSSRPWKAEEIIGGRGATTAKRELILPWPNRGLLRHAIFDGGGFDGVAMGRMSPKTLGPEGGMDHLGRVDPPHVPSPDHSTTTPRTH